MLSSTRQPRYWIRAWWPVALGIAVIVIETQRFMGADHTSGPMRAVWQFFFGGVSGARWEVIHHYIRKTGHFVGYGLLGLAWLHAWRMTLPRRWFFTNAVLALLGTALVAGADEWHQTFLPNRTGKPWDVLLDCCGACTMLILAYAWTRIRRPRRLERIAA